MFDKFQRFFWFCAILAIPLFTGAREWAFILTTLASGFLILGILMNYFEKHADVGISSRVLSFPLAVASFVLTFTILSWVDETLAKELQVMSPRELREIFITYSGHLAFWTPNFFLDIWEGNFASAIRIGGRSVALLIAIPFLLTFSIPPTRGVMRIVTSRKS